MSTENTLTDVTPSGESTASAVTTTGSDTTTQTASPSTGHTLDTLRQMSKDGETFAPKPVEDALKPPPATIPVGPTYAPNFKYKAALQEKEIEDFWKPLIKDADSEKRVKEALTKLDGFEFVKNSREKIQQQYDSLQTDYQSQAQVVQRVEGAIERGDLTSVFRQLGVTDEAIYRWTQQKLQMMEMPPEQRRMFEDAENAKQERQQFEEEKSHFQKLYEDQAVQARSIQLDLVLSRPEIAQAAQTWDSLMGQPGAYRDLVIQEAQTAYFQRGQDLSAEQAAHLVLQKYGRALNQQGGGAQAIASQAQAQPYQTPQPMAPQAKPVIPNVTGKGAAPIKKVPRSLDDLKRMQKELEAASS